MRILRVALRSAAAVCMLLAVIQCADKPVVNPQPPDISVAAVDISGWHQEYEPEIFVGDSLFELINGGAEVYHRFGFVRALATQYADDAGRSISLEVFEMKDVEGAGSIYSDKTGGSGVAGSTGTCVGAYSNGLHASLPWGTWRSLACS